MHAYLSVTSLLVQVLPKIIVLEIHAEHQLWVFDDKTGIPGVFRIASKSVSSLFLTAPLDPKEEEPIFLDRGISGTGLSSQQQLWRLIPSGGRASSVIENYANPGLVLDVPNSDVGRRIQVYGRHGKGNQLFYVDMVLKASPTK